jgi:hypothetical protein
MTQSGHKSLTEEPVQALEVRNVEPYVFFGVVLPERAQISLGFGLTLSHVTTGKICTAKVSIRLNQVVVWVESEHEWDIYDLRNIVKNLLQTNLAMVGYLKGYAYDVDVTRVICQSRHVDQVFGIDIPCISERNKSLDLQVELNKLLDKNNGQNVVFLHRCFNDLVSSMKDADDTGFYCYRAIESLRHHCAATHGLSSDTKSKQWEKFREVAACDEQALDAIKSAAVAVRHGEVVKISSSDRSTLFTKTWDIVDGYLKNI